MKAYSMNLRERVLKDLDSGLKTSAVAQNYTVSPAWVRRLKQRRQATNEVAPRKQRYKTPSWPDVGGPAAVTPHTTERATAVWRAYLASS